MLGQQRTSGGGVQRGGGIDVVFHEHRETVQRAALVGGQGIEAAGVVQRCRVDFQHRPQARIVPLDSRQIRAREHFGAQLAAFQQWQKVGHVQIEEIRSGSFHTAKPSIRCRATALGFVA